jgi:hypothetical protein
VVIGVLTSGVALGVHVPGLLLADRLIERGVPAEVFVLERLLPEDRLATAAKLKWAFHRDFRFALAGQRLGTDPVEAIAWPAISTFADQLVERGVRRLVVFSGFWLPIVAQLLPRWPGDPPPVDICHVDSVASPSFRHTADLVASARQVWLADAEAKSLPCTIPVSREPAVAWPDRARRLLVHGGGWGMGDYHQRARELRAAGLDLDLVAYEHRDMSAPDAGIRHFMLDPDWHPWQDNGYPPFGQVSAGQPRYRRGVGRHGSFDVAAAVMAMVSKPGGGTLLDSLWSATPVVFTEPFGAHEAHNSELWRQLGFGISFEEWRATGFDPDVLEPLHRALLHRAPTVPDYSALLAAGFGGSTSIR